MNISEEKSVSSGYSAKGSNNFLYYGLLVYTILFYSQIGARIPALAPLRVELIVGSILVFLSLVKIINNNVRFNENKLNLAALLFLLAAFITIPFALVKTRALNMFISFIKFFAIYLLIIAAIDDDRKLKGFIYVYLGMITLLFIEPFFLSLQGKGFMYNNHMWRLAGVTHYFGHPNQLGGMTAENLPFFYYFMKYEKSKVGKLIYFSLILIALRVIMLTQSRTAFVGAMTVAFFIWVFNKKKILSLCVIALSCIILWQFAPQQTKDRFLTLSKISETVTTEEADFEDERVSSLGSMASRWEQIRRGFICFLENPILGVGLDCYPSFQGRRWGLWFPPHNTYIQALAEMGIIGFTIFAYLIVMIFKNLKFSRTIFRERGGQDLFLSTMITAVSVYFITRIVVSFFGQDLYANYWWVAGGLSLVLLRIVKSKYQNHMARSLQTPNLKADEIHPWPIENQK